VRPGVKPIHFAQHRLREKEFFRKARHRHRRLQRSAARPTSPATALPGILKTCTEGYDGKGQVRVTTAPSSAAPGRRLGRRECILEALVDFLARSRPSWRAAWMAARAASPSG
jgi:5-(carboxyamino)imidazole ribonucleotide synthase